MFVTLDGNCYYPSGDPSGDAAQSIMRYTDTGGVDFFICYTGAQVQQALKYGLFKPYPVQVTWVGGKAYGVRPS
jgi:hypothetical protein